MNLKVARIQYTRIGMGPITILGREPFKLKVSEAGNRSGQFLTSSGEDGWSLCHPFENGGNPSEGQGGIDSCPTLR
jgi:hypothetical protein